jgi:heme oxygenase
LKNIVLADQLKYDTLFHHQQLEKLIVGKIKSMDSVKGYISLLGHFYSFFGGIEDSITADLVAPYLDDYHTRRKSEKLANDIIGCGGKIPAKAAKTALPAINSAAEAMGALYVMEGSTLGGQIISKMICRQLNFTGEQCLSYFIGYGGQTETMWLRFKQSINKIDESAAPDLISAANDTFIKFKAWIEKND